jgi:hypothetical protein
MIYELRTYWAAPGKIENLHHRFRNLTLGIFKRHNMKVLGFWSPAPATPETGDLVYILCFTDEAAKTTAWTAFQNDPEWINGMAASEVDGSLLARLTSVTLHPTDYSPQE